MEFETVAIATRVTARISLIVFAFAFAIEGLSIRRNQSFALWTSFILAHAIHVICVVAYFVVLGEPPEITLAFGMLMLGLCAIVWMTVSLFRSWRVNESSKLPQLAVWYVWFLFWTAHITRLLDPERGNWINVLLLAVISASAVTRLVTLRSRRMN